MSEEINNQLLAEFLSKVEAACHEGKGEDLLKNFYRQQAESYADTVFLSMETVLSGSPTQDTDKLFQILHAVPHALSLQLIEAVASTCVHWNMPREHQIAAEIITAEAYRNRLQSRLNTTTQGGAA